MRETINPQLKFCQVDISQIKFDLKSRDDMPKIWLSRVSGWRYNSLIYNG